MLEKERQQRVHPDGLDQVIVVEHEPHLIALGTGRELSFTYTKDIERTTRVAEFRDPSLFGPYWSARLSEGWNSDGTRTRASVAWRCVQASA